jgi:hypothetical protein
MELDVLKGARRAPEHWRPLLVREAQTSDQFDSLRAFLSDLQYRPTRRHRCPGGAAAIGAPITEAVG